jgi:TonB family protein
MILWLALLLGPLLTPLGSDTSACSALESRLEVKDLWSVLLRAAAHDQGSPEDCMKELAGHQAGTPEGNLARALLAEWRLTKSDVRLRSPLLVWRPRLNLASVPKGSRAISSTLVLIRGEVTPRGSFIKLKVLRSSGNESVDDLCRNVASKARFRPAYDGSRFFPKEAVLQFFVDPF